MTALADSQEMPGGGALTVGQLLKRRREERGLDLADIADMTRIPVRHLSAIEENAYEQLPGLPYAVGFVRNYARILGLTPDLMADQFKAEAAHNIPSAAQQAYVPLDDTKTPSRALVIAGLLGAVAVVILWAAYANGLLDGVLGGEPAAEAQPVIAEAPALPTPGGIVTAPEPQGAIVDETTDAPPVTAQEQPATARPDAASPAPAAPAPINVAADAQVVITANDDAWIRVYDQNNRTVRMGIMAAGERYEVPAGEALLLRTGRAGQLSITVDGQAISPLGEPNELVRDVSLAPVDLLARGQAQ